MKWNDMKKILISVAAVIVCTGCGWRQDASPVGSFRTVERAFNDMTAGKLGNTAFTDNVEVFHLSFETQPGLGDWHTSGLKKSGGKNAPEGLMRTTSTDSQFVLDVDFASRSVDSIEVVFQRRPSKSAVELFWADEKSNFKPGRKISLFKGEKDPNSNAVTYTFPVGSHPRWRGSVAKIRIDPTDQDECQIDLVSVSGFKKVANPDRIQELASTEHRIDQCGDIRSGRIVPPGLALSVPVEIPENAKIRFSYGLQNGVAGPVGLQVRLNRGKKSRQIFETVIEGDEPFDCRWREEVVDLSSFGRGGAEVVFSTEVEGDFDLSRGFPVVSQVEVIAPVTERNSPNVIVIVLDTLRADRMSLYGYERETSAKVGAWANRDGVVFENTITAAPWTLPSHVSLFTGLDSVTHGMTSGDPVPLGLEMMAERLQKQGYRTAAFTGGGYVGENYRVMQGFDTLSYWFTAKRKVSEVGNDLVAGLSNAVDWLDQTQEQVPSQPFFLFFHTYEVHTPYRQREPFFSQFHVGSGGEPMPPVKTIKAQSAPVDGFRLKKTFAAMGPGEPPRYQPLEDRYIGLASDLYDSGVAFADLHIGQWLDYLDESGLSENTVVVFTSDHGESLGERGLAGHSSLEEWEIKIPLVIASPGLENFRGTRVKTQVRLIDVMPTVFDLIGIEAPANIDGVTLLPAIHGADHGLPGDAITYASSSNFGLALRHENSIKYEFNNSPWAPIFATERLFLLEEDPLCTTDVVETSNEAERYRQMLFERFDQSKAGLRMLYTNATKEVMTVTLEGGLAKPLNVKSIEPNAKALVWSGDGITFEVPEQSQRTLFFDGSPFVEFSVLCAFENPDISVLSTKIRLDDIGDRWQAQFEEGMWNVGNSADSVGNTGISAWIQGWATDSVFESAIDEETLEILRGLGYVE